MAGIVCKGLSKRYGATTVIDRLDLEIRDTEFLVLLGPSGCGKTTTLNIIAGLEDLSEGQITFDGVLMNDVPPHKREIAMVFQSYALYPQKTIFENIAFGLRLRRVPDAEVRRLVADAAERLEITHLLERRPAELSGGQRQRVALGRAIVRKPTAFLMDEPLSNLDAALRLSMRVLIKRLHQTMGTTFVYVTHDQGEAMSLADRIVVMRNGVIEQMGTPDEIYRQPRNTFVASFLGSPQINLIEGVLTGDAANRGFARGEFSLALNRRGLAGHAGREVTLGVRPEDLRVAPAGELSAMVELVSPQGSEQYVNVRISGIEAMLRLDNHQKVAPGDTLRLSVDQRLLHVFDRTTGESLTAGLLALDDALNGSADDNLPATPFPPRAHRR
ncbi:ABC transporter ATP-binding protein [Bradyrhizobium prioriisuperbiae]|uniref:ABC transporter ATP-binding protein n=1 Tax=Bradyrhizobium prioriisuperbiae TaxID=2854389 RepID=UPI0028EDBF8A|nr:ABC transporter ATP-binding protein [Bradyrhizobium prioritasuperba]